MYIISVYVYIYHVSVGLRALLCTHTHVPEHETVVKEHKEEEEVVILEEEMMEEDEEEK